MKKYSIILLLLLGIFGSSFIFTKRFLSQQTPKSDSDQIQVITSFYPLYFFAKEIGGSNASVINLTPAGSEPHDFDPSPQQVALIQQSQILIINGAGFEPWSSKMRENLQGKDVMILSFEDQFVDNDPHLWLSPTHAKTQVQEVLEAYQQVDPEHKEKYAQNAQTLLAKLDTLDQEFQQSLATCTKREFVTSHDAFSYLARQYNIKQVPISGISPDEEPSAAELATVAQFVKENSVKVIFFETLVSPKLAETIAVETGAITAVLNPLEGLTEEELQSGQDYFSKQRENLSALQTALECQ